MTSLAIFATETEIDIKGNSFSFQSPPIFLPSIPSALDSDDSYIIYHYQFTGTGGWGGDPEYDVDGLVLGAEEDITHVKTNNTTVGSSHSIQFYGWFYNNYCPCSPNDPSCFPHTFYTDTEVCTNNDYAGGCGDSVPWYFDPNDIVAGPTTNYVACGTIITGESYYEKTLNPWYPDGPGGACGVVPKSFHFGRGRLLTIDLTITSNCVSSAATASSLFSSATQPMFCRNQDVIQPTTLLGEAFDSNGHFQISMYAHGGNTTNSADFTGAFGTNGFHFQFSAPSNTTYSVFASTNFQYWDYLGDVFLDGTNMHGDFVDNSASNYAQRFYTIAVGSYGYAPEGLGAYGFVKKSLSAGDAMIANPLLTSNMTIANLFSNVPDSTTLKWWAVTNWGVTATFSSGSWDHPDWTLMPGGGALIHVPTNVTLTFIGNVIEGPITNIIPSGIAACSSIYVTPDIKSLGLVLTNGDVLQKWNGTSFISYTNTGLHWSLTNCSMMPGWSPSTPNLAAGESFLIKCNTNHIWGGVFWASDLSVREAPVAGSHSAIVDGRQTGTDLYVAWPLWDVHSTVPNGAMVEVGNEDNCSVLVPLTDTVWETEEPTLLDNIYESIGSQGCKLRVRYRNANLCGPWSNWVQY